MDWKHRNILDSVERWAEGYMMIRETGIGVTGRVDSLLVPVSFAAHCMKSAKKREPWERPRLIGVEVKTNRADFLRGQKIGQYDRYAQTLGGLYVATLKGVCKTAELPLGIGHLVVMPMPRGSQWRTACRKHPRYQDRPPCATSAWQILFKTMEAQRAFIFKEKRRRKDVEEHLGHIVGEHVIPTLRALRGRLEEMA